MPPGVRAPQDLAFASPPLRIMVLGDRPKVMDALRRCFEEGGHHTTLVSLIELRHAYEECVRLIVEHRPDVVLFDLRTPEASGWDFLQALRETAPLHGYPFVTTTSDAAALDRATGEDTRALDLTDEDADFTAVRRAVEAAARPAAV